MPQRTGMMSGMDASAMEPMLVEESELALEDIAATLLADSNGLAKRMQSIKAEAKKGGGPSVADEGAPARQQA